MKTAISALASMLVATVASAQYHQTDFPAEEFRARHAQVFDKIGANAVAVVQGVHQTEGYTLPRQHNTFYYLSGIETPGAYLLLDGRTRTATIYLPSRNPRLEAAEGRVMSADDAELVKRIAGVDAVRALGEMIGSNWPLGTQTGGRGRDRAAANWCILSPDSTLHQSTRSWSYRSLQRPSTGAVSRRRWHRCRTTVNDRSPRSCRRAAVGAGRGRRADLRAAA